jgi:hypothetical protein
MPPGFDQHLGLPQGIESLAIEQLIAKLAIEAFTMSVFPGAARFDVGRLGADIGDPVTQSFGNEIRGIVERR